MGQGPEGPGCLLDFDVFPAELQSAGSKNQASDWPQNKPVPVTREPVKPRVSEIRTVPLMVLEEKPRSQ